MNWCTSSRPLAITQRQEKVETIVGDSRPVEDLAEHLEKVINPEAGKVKNPEATAGEQDVRTLWVDWDAHGERFKE